MPEPFPIGSSGSLSFGRTTQRFFVEGEQHEAAKWEDVVLPPDDEPDPSVHSGSFDKIPRRRSATIMLVALAALLVFGIIMSARFFLNTGRKVDAAKTAYTRTPPAAPVTKSAPVAAEPPAVPSASPSTAPGGGSTEEARTPPELVHGTAAAPGDEKVPESAAPAVQRPSRPHAKRSRSLENYVWSPTAQALVPAAVAATPATARQTRSRATKGPSSLPNSDKPTIEPATTGDPPSERPAPTPESE